MIIQAKLCFFSHYLANYSHWLRWSLDYMVHTHRADMTMASLIKIQRNIKSSIVLHERLANSSSGSTAWLGIYKTGLTPSSLFLAFCLSSQIPEVSGCHTPLSSLLRTTAMKLRLAYKSGNLEIQPFLARWFQNHRTDLLTEHRNQLAGGEFRLPLRCLCTILRWPGGGR